jgi:hypothetical protein
VRSPPSEPRTELALRALRAVDRDLAEVDEEQLPDLGSGLAAAALHACDGRPGRYFFSQAIPSRSSPRL